MAIRLVDINIRRPWRPVQIELRGVSGKFRRYELKMLRGEILCPLTVEFRDQLGHITTKGMIPLTTDGKPKISPTNGVLYGVLP